MFRGLFKKSILNSVIGFTVFGIGLGVGQSINDRNADIYLYNLETRGTKITWKYTKERDNLFYSSMLFSVGGLGMLGTGQLIWAIPGTFLVLKTAISQYKNNINIDEYN